MPRRRSPRPAALITGAARRLGRSIALALAQDGADIVVHYRGSKQDATTLARELRRHGARAWLVRADLSDPAQADTLADRAADACGRPCAILVNNASIFPAGRLDAVTAADLELNMRVHAYAPLALARAFARRWPRPSKGPLPCIVNLLDSRITDYDAAHAAYHVSKRALHTLTMMMALEYAPRVRVNAVAPGLILPPPGETAAYLRKLAHTNPLNRFGRPEDIAEAVRFLVRSAFVTGQVLYVDGGRHLRGSLYGL
jgi:pteridine reductase